MKKTMKKTIALVLCLLMVVSLAACGGQATADESSASAEQTETAEPTTEETTQQEEISKPVETEPEETEPNFDTSWAGADYIMPIPEPPFTQFSVDKSESQETIQYIIFADGDEIAALTQDDVLAYTEALKDAGFSCVDYEGDFDMVAYTYAAYTEDQSAHVVYECHIQQGKIAIVLEQKLAQVEKQDEKMESNAETLLGSQFPTIPDGYWVEKEPTTDTFCYLYAEKIDRSKIVDFCDMLIASGWFLAEEGDAYRADITQTYRNDGGQMVRIRYQGEENSGSCFLTIVLEF